MLIPMCKWAQRSDKVYVTLEIPGCAANPTIKLDNDGEGGTLVFAGKDNAGQEYSLDLKLCGKIKPAESKVSVQRYVQLALEKEEAGYWKKLTRGPGKDNQTHIKVDWDRWVDEDDEGEEEAPGMGGFDLEGMKDYASFMGGHDSDDEEGLADLVK